MSKKFPSTKERGLWDSFQSIEMLPRPILPQAPARFARPDREAALLPKGWDTPSLRDAWEQWCTWLVEARNGRSVPIIQT